MCVCIARLPQLVKHRPAWRRDVVGLQSHLFSLAGLIGLFNNTIGMRALVAGLGETNMMRFGILVYAAEMVRACSQAAGAAALWPTFQLLPAQLIIWCTARANCIARLCGSIRCAVVCLTAEPAVRRRRYMSRCMMCLFQTGKCCSHC